ncbi:MAG: hypothetical protein AAF621_08525 [Pseudomonadota bacterium]
MPSYKSEQSQDQAKAEKNPDLPVSFLFLKSLVAALGIVLVCGFVFVVGLVLLGGKYFVEQTEFEPYKLAKSITLSPEPVDKIISAKTSPLGVEILSRSSDGKYILSVYNGEDGTLFSEVVVKAGENKP